MNAVTRVSMAALSALLLSACAAPIKSTIDQADNVDISSYKTYAWISDEPYTAGGASALVNPLNYQRIRTGIENELDAKGYVMVPRDEADLVLGFTLGARDRVRIQHYYDTFGYRYFGYYGRFGRVQPGFGISRTVHTYTEGTLAVDLFDNRSKQAIWHGTATRSLGGDETGQRLIADAVAALIGPLPARPMTSASLRDPAPRSTATL